MNIIEAYEYLKKNGGSLYKDKYEITLCPDLDILVWKIGDDTEDVRVGPYTLDGFEGEQKSVKVEETNMSRESELSKFTEDELKAELDRRVDKNEYARKILFKYADSPIGLWEVSTEGDAEGRKVRHLGMYYGHIADIAKDLSREALYTLMFKKVDKPILKPKSYVDVQLDIHSGLWDEVRETRAELVKELLNKDKPQTTKDDYEVVASNYYGSVRIKFSEHSEKSV